MPDAQGTRPAGWLSQTVVDRVGHWPSEAGRVVDGSVPLFDVVEDLAGRSAMGGVHQLLL